MEHRGDAHAGDAACSGCAARSRLARARRDAVGATTSAAAIKAVRRCRASSSTFAGSGATRCCRYIADWHSTGAAHQIAVRYGCNTGDLLVSPRLPSVPEIESRLVEALPKNDAGKVLKHKIRASLTEGG